MPEDKASYAEKKRQSGTVIMIGDGINDHRRFPLQTAVSLSVRESGNCKRDCGMYGWSADDLNELVKLKELSNKLTKRVESNFRFIMGSTVHL